MAHDHNGHSAHPDSFEVRILRQGRRRGTRVEDDEHLLARGPLPPDRLENWLEVDARESENVSDLRIGGMAEDRSEAASLKVGLIPAEGFSSPDGQDEAAGSSAPRRSTLGDFKPAERLHPRRTADYLS